MRSRILFIALVLWLGLTSTVASAWFFASMWHSPGRTGSNRLSWWSGEYQGQANEWGVYARTGPGKEAIILAPLRRDLAALDPNWQYEIDKLLQINMPAWSLVHQPPGAVAAFPNDDGAQPFIMQDARGWPFPSLYCTWVMEHQSFRMPSDHVRHGVPIAPLTGPWLIVNRGGGGMVCGLSSDFQREDLRALPLAPAWTGFLGSTAVWSVAWVALLMTMTLPGYLIRVRRARKNRCTHCGYDVSHVDSVTCAECGWSVGRMRGLLLRRTFTAAGVLAVLIPGTAAAIAWHGAASFTKLAPMQVAAHENDAEAIRQFLAQGVSPEQTCDVPFNWQFAHTAPADATPLFWAVANDNMDAVNALISGGADLNTLRGSETPLTVAIEHKQLGAFHLLIETGAQLDGEDSPYSGWPLLHQAARSGTPSMVRILIEHIENREHDHAFNTALCAAAEVGKVETMRALLEAGADVNGEWVDEWGFQYTRDDVTRPIAEAVSHGHLDAVELLLASGADVASSERPLVHDAAKCNDMRMVTLLLDAGADQSIAGAARDWPHEMRRVPPLYQAMRNNNLDMARLLLERGANAAWIEFEYGRSLLFCLTSLEDTAPSAEWIALLLEHGADLDHRDDAGNTALMVCLYFSRFDLAEVLIRAGADTSLVNALGYSARDYAERALPIVAGKRAFEARTHFTPDEELLQLIRKSSAESIAAD